MSRICLVGAGFIARVHADALASLPGRRVTAVVDPNTDAASRLARVCGNVPTFTSVAEAIAAGGFDRAHVLVPPDRHGEAALPLLQAGIPVLLEKPLAVSQAECDTLLAAVAETGTALGVNQNFVHHPAFVRLSSRIAKGAFGQPRFIGCVYNVPLRQMAARQFGHWMFREPGNILLEQAVHPLSQIVALAGEVHDFAARPGPVRDIAPGVPFVQSLEVSLGCARLPAQLRFAVGQDYPFWQVTAVCDDGVVVADILANRCFAYGRTRWLEALDTMLSGLATAGAIARDSVANLAAYGLATAKLRRRSDAFFVSMRGAIGAFHTDLDAGRTPKLDAGFGAGLVGVCARIAAQTFPRATPKPRQPAPERWDVAILGGTGFIGTHTVRRFVEAGERVAVMARNLVNLPEIFAHPNVALIRGDIRDATAVARAISSAARVVNLAHGGGGADFAAIRAAMVGGAETVARACQAAGVRRLVHVGSIASLYLGPQERPVTGATPPDEREAERGDYARAKVLADRLMVEMHAREGLPIVILRPGVVVGEGSSPFHSALGFYNTEQHCIGWNAGTNPLPFVLVEDVAESILRATLAEGVEGRCFNIVGDVRPSARAYIADLALALGRPLRFHPQSPRWLWLEDSAKWVVKRATGRAVPAPAMRDFLSRGMLAAFDCTDAQNALDWHPVADPVRFRERAVLVHAVR